MSFSKIVCGLAIVAALLVGLAPATPAHAAETRFEKDGTAKVDEGESIDDTVFLAGDTAIVAGVVEGDVFAAAERVEITGKVRGNLYCAGESVTISGEVSGNVHAAGREVVLGAKVSGSGYLAGKTVTVSEAGELAHGGYLAGETVHANGRVGRDVYLAGKDLEVSGTVARSVRAAGAKLALRAESSIGGDLRATVPSEDAVTIENGATVSGETEIDVEEDWGEERTGTALGFIAGAFGQAIALLVFGLVAVRLFPALRPNPPTSSNDVLRSLGLGLVVLIATPLAMLMIALSLIGIPISIVLGMAYGVILYASTLVVAYFAARQLPGADDRNRLILWTSLCLILLFLSFGIPFLGPLLRFLTLIFGLGALVIHLWELYRGTHGSGGAPAGALVA